MSCYPLRYRYSPEYRGLGFPKNRMLRLIDYTRWVLRFSHLWQRGWRKTFMQHSKIISMTELQIGFPLILYIYCRSRKTDRAPTFFSNVTLFCFIGPLSFRPRTLSRYEQRDHCTNVLRNQPIACLASQPVSTAVQAAFDNVTWCTKWHCQSNLSL